MRILRYPTMIYTYYGREGERVPKDVTAVIFHRSVTTIQPRAFFECRSLVRVTIPDTVTRIEYEAFMGCDSLRLILFPRTLEHIRTAAFEGCNSLEAVFLPSTVNHIDDHAFNNCKSLRSVYMSDTIEWMGYNVFDGCDQLSATFNMNPDHQYDDDEVNQRLTQYFPFHQACSSTDVTPLMIEACIQEHGMHRATELDNQQMTALHILCANPRVNSDAIRAYLTLTHEAAYLHGIECAEGVHEDHVMALHILCSNQFVTGDVVRAYMQLVPQAAEEEDSEGMTPFQHLCENAVTFGADRNFSSLMAWWYSCMP